MPNSTEALTPTTAELAFFDYHVNTIDPLKIIRGNHELMMVEPSRIRLRHIDELTKDDQNIDKAIAKILDIFMRKMILDGGGSLEHSIFWFGINHPGIREKDGFWVRHKTYKEANGAFIMNLVAKFTQSNNVLRIDEQFASELNLFSKDNSTLQLIGNGIHDVWGGPKGSRVLGEAHCLPKAFVIGIAYPHPRGEKQVRCSSNVFYVDGYCEQTNVVSEVHVCYYHGCPKRHTYRLQPREAMYGGRTQHFMCHAKAGKCYTIEPTRSLSPGPSRITQNPSQPREAMYGGRTQHFMCHAKAGKCYTIEPTRSLSPGPSRITQNPSQPREAMYGGRTQHFMCHAKAGKGYTIEYVDFCSLYPHLNK